MAQQQSVNTSDKPTVVIGEANGELRLMGWDRREVLARTDDQVALNQDGDTVNVQFSGEAVVRVPEGATLHIERVNSDSRIKGVNGEVTIGSASGDLALRHTGPVRISSSSGDTSLKHVTGEVHIDRVSGDLSVLDAQGAVMIGNVGGDLSTRGIQGPMNIGNVSGDCSAEGVQGALSADQIGGDARLVGVQGNVRLGNVSGDASLAGVQGELQAGQVGGDLNAEGLTAITATVSGDANLSWAAGLGRSTVTAGGDIACRVAPDANATLHLTSGSSNISIDLPGIKNKLEQHDYELKLGNGEMPITLNASGDLRVGDWAGEPHGRGFNFDFNFDFGSEGFFKGNDWSNFGDRIAQRAQAAAERATARVQEQAERAARKAEEQAMRATRKAEEQVRRAQDQARRAERRAQFMGRRFGPDVSWRPDRPPAPEPPSEPVSDEERLTILRMLEQKKITVEQAEKLLAALSGKDR